MNNRINLTTGDFESSNPKHSGAFKKLGGEITKNLSLSQQKSLYEKLKEHKGSVNSVQEALRDLKRDTKDGVSGYAVGRMERAFKDRGKSDINKNSSLQARQSESSTARIEKASADITKRASGPQLSQNLVNRTSGAMNSGLIVKR